MKKVLVALVMVFAVFTVAACGQDEFEQGVFEDRVIVGNTAATSGPLAFVGVPFKAGMDAYFNMVNEEGGVAGRMIEYIQKDDEFNAALGLSYTQELVEDDQVFALVGHFGTPTVSATREYLNEVGIPRVYYATGVSSLFNLNATGGERSSFPVQPIFDAEGEVMVARAIKDLGAERIGVIYSNADDGRGMLRGIQLRAGELGVALTSVVQVAPDADDMSTAAQIMLAANVDVVIVAANQVPAATAVRALDDANSTIPVITSYVNADATWLGGLVDVIGSFDIYGNAWIDIFNPDGTPTDDYVLFAETIGEEFAANAFAFAGWIAAATFVEGLRRVGDEPLTWESFINAMEESPVPLPFGVVVDYANGRRVGTQAMALLKAAMVDGAPLWQTERPIETITEILGD